MSIQQEYHLYFNYLHYFKILIPNVELLDFFLNIYIILFIFYNCLKLKFKSIDKINLFIFFPTYLSPSLERTPFAESLVIIFYFQYIFI